MYLRVTIGREGQVLDVHEFCSDPCHRAWCRENGQGYPGNSQMHHPAQNTHCHWCRSIIPGPAWPRHN